ncbi:helix-turn-helix transcriptional regulator [Gallaecimonas mangrovi]|uniref:helix-turn-helix transcriptional regulator n=1 Tax=Gallaecimonas mangrovi TaxID=2291597 RepID=UPI00126032BB|nr:PAS domain-containing protein [Gallaecimonas mangrovi]
MSKERQGERQLVIDTLATVVNLLEHMLSDNIEVVLHDISTPESSVVAIANGHISGRTIGDPILAGPKGDVGFANARMDAEATGEQNTIIKEYNTVTKNGVTLNSATAVFRDSGGQPFAALCLNADMTIPHLAHAWLGRMLNRGGAKQQENRKPAEMGGLMEDIIASVIEATGKPVSLLTKEEKLGAVASMQASGLFIVRGGVKRAADALGVTRFTIYNYLDELKHREEA